jgi:hypothetical protein
VANITGPVRSTTAIRLLEFVVAAAGASEVFALGAKHYNVISCSCVYTTAAAPTPPAFEYDASAGTVEMTGHQAGSNLKVLIWVA